MSREARWQLACCKQVSGQLWVFLLITSGFMQASGELKEDVEVIGGWGEVFGKANGLSKQP